jgi:plasmid stabilization system protein ParE
VTVVFHPLAERELIAAAKFYETRASGLGANFIREVERTLTEIVTNPDAGNRFAGSKFRRRLLRRFPFGLVYQLDLENTLVIAVMHLRRRPGYWKRRLRSGSSARR